MIIANQIEIYPSKYDDKYWIHIEIMEGSFEIKDSHGNTKSIDLSTFFPEPKNKKERR